MKRILLILIAFFALGWQNVRAQDGIKIVTNHPDFKVKVTRCVASGKTVIIDMTLNNVGETDVEGLNVWGGARSEAYDDEGHIYKAYSIKIIVANYKDYTTNNYSFNIPAGVPMKLSVSIDGVSQSAESIARLKICLYCKAWTAGCDFDKPLRISNIPISRE